MFYNPFTIPLQCSYSIYSTHRIYVWVIIQCSTQIKLIKAMKNSNVKTGIAKFLPTAITIKCMTLLMLAFLSFTSCGKNSRSKMESADMEYAEEEISMADEVTEENGWEGADYKAEEAAATNDLADKFYSQSEQKYAANVNMYRSVSDESGLVNNSQQTFGWFAKAPNLNPAQKQKMRQSIGSAAAKQSTPGRKLITTSNLRFRVSNVFSSTEELESLAIKHGGFILNSDVKTNMTYSNSVRISPDSTMKIEHFTKDGNLKVRVPFQNLHDFLMEMAPMIDYLDLREIEANDVTLKILSNDLMKKRTAQYNARLSKRVNSTKDLGDITYAENQLLEKQASKDLAFISNLQMEDQIAFSTITMTIYEPTYKSFTKVKDEPKVEYYQPSYASKLKDAVQSGFKGFKSFILFWVRNWFTLLTLALIGYGLYRLVKYLTKNKGTKKSKNTEE